jgi:hypothetical protein
MMTRFRALWSEEHLKKLVRYDNVNILLLQMAENLRGKGLLDKDANACSMQVSLLQPAATIHSVDTTVKYKRRRRIPAPLTTMTMSTGAGVGYC